MLTSLSFTVSLWECPWKKNWLMYTICTPEKKKPPQKNNKKDSFECLPDREDNYCSNSAGVVLLVLKAIPASPAVERSDFRKQTWLVPSLPTCGLTSSQSLFSRSASASVLTQAICTSHQPWRTKHNFGQGFWQTNFRTALMSCLIYTICAGESEGLCDIRQCLPAGKHAALCLSLPGLTFTSWHLFCSSLVDKQWNQNKPSSRTWVSWRLLIRNSAEKIYIKLWGKNSWNCPDLYCTWHSSVAAKARLLG